MNQPYPFTYAFGLVALLTPFMAAQTQPQANQRTSAHVDQKASAKQNSPVLHNEGDRIFAQNCSRCHTAPDGFSPNISGTVVRHMRVRASLSQHDEQELLRFLNP
ncbi:cytochrome c [Tunturibacter empetritectus]|uniref:Cytochrome c n=1 Tax=Tunturiibacter empetritectus TaxID=3069691 RepID=A0AAU7Z9E8_9BACT